MGHRLERKVIELERRIQTGKSAAELLAEAVASWRRAGINSNLVELAIQRRLHPYVDVSGRLRWIEMLPEDLDL